MKRHVPWLAVILAGCLVVDADGDGWGRQFDCDEDSALVGGPEVVYDGVDNDCDPSTLDDDLDRDGFRHTVDCDDDNPEVGGDEVPYDGIDNDCDPATPDDDLDADGLNQDLDCDDEDASRGGPEVVYDGIDNDCDPSTRDDDLDGDGAPTAEDCNDQDATVQLEDSWPGSLGDGDVTGFCEGYCTRPVVGSILFEETTPIDPVADLGCIDWVGGDVTLLRTGWTTMDPLSGLEWVGGDVVLSQNLSLSDGDATTWAQAIDYIGGTITIGDDQGAP